MNKEKKRVTENCAKASDDLLTAQEKVDHLDKIKIKLEQTLDELESSLSREKRQRAQTEKERRHVEGDLKVTQEMVLDLERTRKEMEGVIQRKEKDISGLFVKLEDEQSLVAKMQKHIKENQSRYSTTQKRLKAIKIKTSLNFINNPVYLTGYCTLIKAEIKSLN
jgi:chromosome segregation ATPase